MQNVYFWFNTFSSMILIYNKQRDSVLSVVLILFEAQVSKALPLVQTLKPVIKFNLIET